MAKDKAKTFIVSGFVPEPAQEWADDVKKIAEVEAAKAITHSQGPTGAHL